MMPFPSSDENTLRVSELNGLIKDVVNMGFPNAVWICGEIQGYNRNKDKNHIFFELCEKNEVSKDIVARIGLVIFAGRKAYIRDILESSAEAFQLKDDIEIRFLCRVDFYPPHGAMRLIVESVDPVYTLGKIAQEKQKLIALLKKKGTLDKNKTVALPLVPLSIGLITAYDSAAYNDFLSELKASGYGFQIFCRNTLMQGKSAPADVCRAIRELEAIQGLDLLVITRGGGSIAELSCFDSEQIAEAVAACRLPVLSGIGHEINITVTDLAAHTYQKTPTAIAQFLVGRISAFLEEAETKTNELLRLAVDRIDTEKKNLKNNALLLQQGSTQFFKVHHQDLIRRREILRHLPLKRLSACGLQLQTFGKNLARSAQSLIKNEKERLKNYRRLTEMADPGNALRRGFTITRGSDGKILRSVKQVGTGDPLTTVLTDGEVKSIVK